ncbi:MAG TPA: Hsp70 family protein, partial [Myxococcota bacterium]|nr:Hsp70 family protein [Myxococcota bacterium]
MTEEATLGVAGPVIGVDVGLRHLAMASLDADGRARVIPNAEGHPRTPAAVHFYQADGVVVGDEAMKVAALEPEFTSPDVIALLGEASGLTFFERAWSPQELVALVLRKLREDAEDLRGEDVTDACLAVPGFFDSAQRAALLAAAEIAGWNVRAVVPHATASLVGLGLDGVADGARALLLDVRERGVEATLVRRDGDELHTLAGEHAIDAGLEAARLCLERALADAWRSALDEDPTEDPLRAAELRASTADALEVLARSTTAMARLGLGDRRVGHRLEREQAVKAIWEPITTIARLGLGACRRDGGRPPDVILLAGEGAGLPGLRRALQFALRVEPQRPEGWADASVRGAA